MYKSKNFEHLLGAEGFSDDLLQNHFTLYQGYVSNTNKLVELLKEKEAGTPKYAELRRRFGWEFNGMRLHEYYFENMSKDKVESNKESNLAKKIIEDFGSLNEWAEDFRSTGAIRGIGWVILYYDSEEKRLFNVWINEHDMGHLAGAKPLLVMDVFEHAFLTDYGLKRADYIDAFFKVVDWNVVDKRFI